MQLSDALWVWGHPANSLKGAFGITQDSSFAPGAGAAWLGAKNVWLVPMNRPEEPDALCAEALAAGAQTLGYSIERAGEDPAVIDRLIALHARCPQVDRGVFDDFFNEENVGSNRASLTPEALQAMREKLHAAGMSMWMVLYTRQFDTPDIRRYIDVFDGVTLWFWEEREVAAFAACCRRFFDLTPRKRRMVGCYLYDFGGGKPADAPTVLCQLEAHRRWLHEGVLEGVILHTNAVLGMGHPAPQAAREWVARHGAELL